MAMATFTTSEPVQKGKGVTQFKIGIITDLDKLSKGVDEEGETIWKSLISTGTLTYDEINKKVEVEMAPKDDNITITSEYSRGLRGMELSELILYNGRLYSVDDRTGIVYNVSRDKAIPWVILPDGDGNQSSGFKGEWMTKKCGQLYVGGHGRERMSDDGKTIVHTRFQWVKIISGEGAVKHVNWAENFDALRKSVGCPFPGYLTHESGMWSDVHQQWFFLPRKVSKEVYDWKLDETRAGNILVRSCENFKNITHCTVGELRPSRGYSTFKFIPGTNDTVIVAIKSEEIGDAQKSFVQVFTIDGEVLLDDQYLGDMKFEGIEFI